MLFFMQCKKRAKERDITWYGKVNRNKNKKLLPLDKAKTEVVKEIAKNMDKKLAKEGHGEGDERDRLFKEECVLRDFENSASENEEKNSFILILLKRLTSY